MKTLSIIVAIFAIVSFSSCEIHTKHPIVTPASTKQSSDWVMQCDKFRHNNGVCSYYRTA